LTVDDVAIDGKVMTMTGSSGDTFVTTVAANGATSLVTTDAAAAAAHLAITADGTVDINSTGVLTLNSSTDLVLDAGDAAIILKDDGTQFGKIENNSTNIRIYSGTAVNTTMTGAAIAFAGDLTVPNKIIHAGDTNTFIHFPADDRFQVQAGGLEIIDAMNTSQDYLTLGTSSDIDVKLIGGAGYIFIQGSDGAIGVGSNSPGGGANSLDVAGSITSVKTIIGGTTTDTSNTGNVTLDFTAGNNFVLTLTGNTTLVNPSTEVVGQSGFIAFIQDGTGGRTITLGTDYETAGNAGITLTAGASTTDLVPYVVVAVGRILLGTPQRNFS